VIPLFPLGTVLFPGGVLPLRIFEPRYLDMIGRCLRAGDGFGVNLIRSGLEVGEAAACWPVGTYARIRDWQSLPGGLLGITVAGEGRYRIRRTEVRTDNLVEADVEWLEEGETLAAADLEGEDADWLRRLRDHYGLASDPGSVGGLVWRLAERLPLPLPARQTLLELNDDQARLAEIRKLLQMSSRQGAKTQSND
jgi:Lon protease-like protein